ncbi:MAG: 16S rRNA (uracil(1498)-N(3))-methyltransferase [Candidatus Omnitrophica bacterium]|nr:16S rRNA (uracil(1498)-N(3))-methyltransferase [Candidatus Omnitrophota bacterium]
MNARDPEQDVSSNRRLKRFFSFLPLTTIGQRVFLQESESRHLCRTLRLKKGQCCLVIDGQGREAEAVIETLDPQKTAVKTIRMILSQSEEAIKGWKICFYVACPKKGKLDDMIEKAQEIGVAEVIPLETARTEIKFSADRMETIQERWRKITREAAKQSGASRLTEVKPVMKFKQALEGVNGDPALFFHPVPEAIFFRDWIYQFQKPKESEAFRGKFHAFIGPEGGFSDEEVILARSRQVTMIRLGLNILKVDTAFVTAAFALKTFLNCEE